MTKTKYLLALISFILGAINGIYLPEGYSTTPNTDILLPALGAILFVILINTIILYYRYRTRKTRRSIFIRFFEYVHLYYFFSPFFISAGLFGLLSTLIRGSDQAYYLISLFILLCGVLFSLHFVEYYFVTKKSKT